MHTGWPERPPADGAALLHPNALHDARLAEHVPADGGVRRLQVAEAHRADEAHAAALALRGFTTAWRSGGGGSTCSCASRGQLSPGRRGRIQVHDRHTQREGSSGRGGTRGRRNDTRGGGGSDTATLRQGARKRRWKEVEVEERGTHRAENFERA